MKIAAKRTWTVPLTGGVYLHRKEDIGGDFPQSKKSHQMLNRKDRVFTPFAQRKHEINFSQEKQRPKGVRSSRKLEDENTTRRGKERD